MPIELGKRLRTLVTSKDDTSLELVMSANGLAALGVAAMAWLKLGLTIGWVVCTVAGTFVLLTVCLLFRYTVWIAAGLGGLAIASSSAALLGILMGGVPYGPWLGGALGAVGGLAVAFWTYARVARRSWGLPPSLREPSSR